MSGTGDTPSGATATLRAPAVPRLGGALGRYELTEVLGQGAMATVFRARDTRLGREVAVKVMNLAVAARSESAERFRREAQAVAAVKHPGIVEIFDFVAASGGEPAYIVSELIDGPTLKALLDQRRGRLLPEVAALLLLPLAEALAAAHARGVIHRDLKPDNVMIDRGTGASPGSGVTGARVMLTDFGVAHVTGLETMTATGALVGSPAYMSPEQARGQDVGPASDVWALGVMLYQMATGHFPFAGRDPLMVVAAITRGIYRKPSQVSALAGPALDEICGRCLRPLPGDRYASAADLAADLRALLERLGLAPGAAALRRLLDDAEGLDAEVRRRAADAAVAAARTHSRRGEFARALSELSRASSYVPGHAEAERLFARIASRRRWIKVGAAVVGLGALTGVGMALVPRMSARLMQKSALVEEGERSGAIAGGSLDPAATRAGAQVAPGAPGRSEGARAGGGARAGDPAGAGAGARVRAPGDGSPYRTGGPGGGPTTEQTRVDLGDRGQRPTAPGSAAQEALAVASNGGGRRGRPGPADAVRTASATRRPGPAAAARSVAGDPAAARSTGDPAGGPAVAGNQAAARSTGDQAGEPAVAVNQAAAARPPGDQAGGRAVARDQAAAARPPGDQAASPAGAGALAESPATDPGRGAGTAASPGPGGGAKVEGEADVEGEPGGRTAGSGVAPGPGPAPRVNVQIYVSGFFCKPSLDDERPTESPFVHQADAGMHTVWCTMANGTRHRVKTMAVAARAGNAPFRIQIRRGPDGKPEIDPARTAAGPAATTKTTTTGP